MDKRCYEAHWCCWGGPVKTACYVFDACGCKVVIHKAHEKSLNDGEGKYT